MDGKILYLVASNRFDPERFAAEGTFFFYFLSFGLKLPFLSSARVKFIAKKCEEKVSHFCTFSVLFVDC